jgi:hypothetical protein
VEIDRQLSRARALRQWAPDHVFERMTTIGHVNEHGQEVVARTNASGRMPFDRVYQIRCTRCGHRHESDGGEIHKSRCPICPPGVRPTKH